jgi:threonine synthase
MSIRYYSTNRYLNNVAVITPYTGSVSFKEALLMGQAPDEGLFVPDSIPQLSQSDILKLRDKPYWQTAMLVAQAFLSDEFSAEILEAVVKDAYNFPVPLEAVYRFCRQDDGQTHEPLPRQRRENQYSGGYFRRYRQRRGRGL